METQTIVSSKKRSRGLSAGINREIVFAAVREAFVKLNPATLIKNPVMFTVEVVAALTTVLLVRDITTSNGTVGFAAQIVGWLWFTVLFANFAEAVAEGRGKAQAEALRRTRTDTQAKKLKEKGGRTFTLVSALALSPEIWC